MHVSRFLMAASTAIFVTAAFGQSAMDTPFQVRYYSNATAAGSAVINLTDTGSNIGTLFPVNTGAGFGVTATNTTCSPQNPCLLGAPTTFPTNSVGTGNICVNAYLVAPNEELEACCSCWMTPNQLSSWDVFSDLAFNPAGGIPVPSGVIKLVATLGGTSATTCDPTMAGLPSTAYNPEDAFQNSTTGTLGAHFNTVTNSVLSPGMLAWIRDNGTETAFSPSTLTSNTVPSYSVSSTGTVSAIGGFAELTRLTGQCSAFISNVGICKSCRAGGL